MSRIDEIKENLSDGVYDLGNPYTNIDDDVHFLLSEVRRLTEERDSFQRVGMRTLEKLELAKESLAQIKYDYEQTSDPKVVNRMYEEAKEALKQIHED